MMPGRRLAATAVVALLALAGATACQTDPAVAAYVGDTEIRQERVDDIVTQLRDTFQGELDEELAGLAEQLDEAGLADFRHGGQQRIDERVMELRDQTVEMLILREAAGQYVEEEGLSVPEPAPEVFAEGLELPEDHVFVELFAEFWAMMTALASHAEPAEATEEDQREVYDNLRFQDQPLPQPFEEVQPFLTEQALAEPVGFRDLLQQVVADADIRVQPGYDLVYQVPVTIGQASSYLSVPISESSSVVDAD